MQTLPSLSLSAKELPSESRVGVVEHLDLLVTKPGPSLTAKKLISHADPMEHSDLVVSESSKVSHGNFFL